MDWVTFVPTMITGAVGIAGIGGTPLSASAARKSAAENLRMSIAAEEKRARLAEKRRIYANCLATLTLGFRAAIEVKEHRAASDVDEYKKAEREYHSALAAAANAVQEVRLIAPEEVGDLASSAGGLLNVVPQQAGDRFVTARANLITAMRADLGETVPGKEVQSDGSTSPEAVP